MLLLDRLRQAQAGVARRHGHVAILFVDLDPSRRSTTHSVIMRRPSPAGCGERLAGAVRPSDTVARFGGDEFVVFCDDLGSHARPRRGSAIEIAERIQRGLVPAHSARRRGTCGRREHSVSPWSRAANQSPEELLRDADAAMSEPRNRAPTIRDVRSRTSRTLAPTMETENGLATRAGRRCPHVALQPIIDLTTGRCRSVEALLRWADPARGLVPRPSSSRSPGSG